MTHLRSVIALSHPCVLSCAGDADSEVLRLMTEVAEASRQRVAVEAQLAAVQRSDSVARGQLEQARVRTRARNPRRRVPRATLCTVSDRFVKMANSRIEDA